MVVRHEQDDISCEFILKEGFTLGVISSGHYHFHPSFEMHIPVDGDLHIMVEDRELLVHPGEVCVIPPGVIHYIFASSDTYRIGFRFTIEITGKGNEEEICSPILYFLHLKETCVVKDCDVYHKYLKAGVQNIMEGLPAFMTAQLLFLTLFETAWKLAGAEEAPKDREASERSDALLSELIENYLNEHYREAITLPELAQHLKFSSRQTARIIERLFGMNFSALVNRKRLVMAKLLLRITLLSVEEIAAEVGFRDCNYFYRKFSECFDITPGQYRRQCADIT